MAKYIVRFSVYSKYQCSGVNFILKSALTPKVVIERSFITSSCCYRTESKAQSLATGDTITAGPAQPRASAFSSRGSPAPPRSVAPDPGANPPRPFQSLSAAGAGTLPRNPISRFGGAGVLSRTGFAASGNSTINQMASFTTSTSCSDGVKLMKAIQMFEFGDPKVLTVQEIPRPKPKKNQMLIRVEAAGINPVDTYIREGFYKNLPELPAILGKEVAGVIEEIGPECNSKFNLAVGDRVFCFLQNGGYSEYVACDDNNVAPLPSDLTFSQGASLYVSYFTAYRALMIKANIKSHHKVFINGASGGVGTAALQIAKHVGCQVGATAGTDKGLELLKCLGADHVFNHRTSGHMLAAKLEMNDTGFDFIFENAAHLNLNDDMSVLANQGQVLVVGCRSNIEITPRSLMAVEGSVTGVSLAEMSRTEMEHCVQFILDGIADKWLKPIINKEYSLNDASQAHHEILNNPGSYGKLVFKMNHPVPSNST